MVDLRSKTHGAGATQGVNLVVMAYDDRIASDRDGVITARLLDVRVHPGDRRAPGQVNLALVSKKRSATAPGHAGSARYTEDQFACIQASAGENAALLTDAVGGVIGRVYGVRADLLINNGEVVVNTKTLTSTELQVGPNDDGLDIRAQIDASVATARRAREAARANAVESLVVVGHDQSLAAEPIGKAG